MQVGAKIPDSVLDRPVVGAQLAPGSLRDQLRDDEVALLVFLRHFGCIFCRETIAELRRRSEAGDGFPSVVFFFQGSPMEGRSLLRSYWPGVRAIADPELEFYEAFGVRRGGLREMFGPDVWSAKRRAEENGHANGDRSGDIWRMPGVFLVRGSEILWSHAYTHAGDLPDLAAIPAIAGERH